MIGTIETGIVARAAAIIAIVADHSNIASLIGGPIVLLFLVGHNLFRFRGEALLRGEVWGTMFHYAWRLGVFYLAIMASFMAVTRNIDIKRLLFSNYTHYYQSTHLFPEWFVPACIQSIAIVSLVLSSSWIRERIRSRPLATLAVLAMLSGLAQYGVRLLWQFSVPDYRLVEGIIPLLLLAWLAVMAKSPWQKLLPTIGLLIQEQHQNGFENGLEFPGWPSFALIAVIWIPRLPMPNAARFVVNVIGGSALYIYFLHKIFVRIPGRVLHSDLPVINFVVGLLVPILVWWVVEQSGLPQKARARFQSLGMRLRPARSGHA